MRLESREIIFIILFSLSSFLAAYLYFGERDVIELQKKLKEQEKEYNIISIANNENIQKTSNITKINNEKTITIDSLNNKISDLNIEISELKKNVIELNCIITPNACN